MEILFLDIARCEMDDAFCYYQQQMNGLGDDYIKEIMATINRIKLNPYAWSIFSENTRRCLVNRFPFAIIYQIEEKRILIVAIAHLHRNPEYWKNRI